MADIRGLLPDTINRKFLSFFLNKKDENVIFPLSLFLLHIQNVRSLCNYLYYFSRTNELRLTILLILIIFLIQRRRLAKAYLFHL